MAANCNSVVNDRKLLELFGMISMSPNPSQKLWFNEFSFCSLLNNISECQYFDVPFSDPIPSIHNIKNAISLLQVNIRSLNKHENFEVLIEFLTFFQLPLKLCVYQKRE